MVTEVSANYGTSYSNSNETVTVNTMERPATITIQTQLKTKATYTAPTAKKLTYNSQQQELVNKGTSSEGTLMYSLEKNGTYSENVPKAKDIGDYTVWYYVKGDNNHNDSDKQSIKVTISQVITDIGIVTAEIPDDTNDISKVVLKRTNTAIAGILEIKEGQQLVFGNNEIEYIFTPTDDLYETVEGKVIVTVTDTIAPIISGVEDGKTSLIYEIGDKIIKIGKPRRCNYIPYCEYLLQPIVNRTFSFDGYPIHIEITQKAKTLENTTKNRMYCENKIYEEKLEELRKKLLSIGLYCKDLHFCNIGILLNDNKISYDEIGFDVVDDKVSSIESNNNLRILSKGEFVIIDLDSIYIQDIMKYTEYLKSIGYNENKAIDIIFNTKCKTLEKKKGE